MCAVLPGGASADRNKWYVCRCVPLLQGKWDAAALLRIGVSLDDTLLRRRWMQMLQNHQQQ
jgi:hypothetical protein